MPSITECITDQGAIIDIVVNVPDFVRKLLVGTSTKQSAPVYLKALIDTRASISGLSPWVFAKLGLKPHECVNLITSSTPANRPHSFDKYFVQLAIVANGKANYFDEDTAVVSMDAFDPQYGYEALIGRDLLAACFLEYKGMDFQFSLHF